MARTLVSSISTKKRNYIINGAMDFWQRGTIQNTVSAFTYQQDRWWNNKANDPLNVTRQGISSLNMGVEYAARYEKAGGSGFWSANTSLETETLNQLKGKNITASVYIRKSATLTSDMTIQIKTTSTEAKNGATVESASTLISNADISDSVFTRYSVTLAVPIGTTANGLEFEVSVDGQSGAAGVYFEMTMAMINEGSVAAPFQRAGITLSEERRLCKKFYFASNGRALIINGDVTNAFAYITYIYFPVNMRTSPTLSFSNVNAASFSTADPSIAQLSTDKARLSKVATATAASAIYEANYQADAEL